MTIFHDKLGNRLAMTETDALALGYTYKHKGLKMSEKVNQECSSTKANELADELDNLEIVCKNPSHLIGMETYEQAFLRCNSKLKMKKEAATMLRQQQAEIEALKQIIDANNLNQNIGQFVKPTNELADEVMEHYRAMLPRGFNVNWMQEAATMLRQQQAEIEALKKENDHLRMVHNYKMAGFK